MAEKEKAPVKPADPRQAEIDRIEAILKKAVAGSNTRPAGDALNQIAEFIDTSEKEGRKDQPLAEAWRIAGMAYNVLEDKEKAYRCFCAAKDKLPDYAAEYTEAYFRTFITTALRDLGGKLPEGEFDMLENEGGLPGIRGRKEIDLPKLTPTSPVEEKKPPTPGDDIKKALSKAGEANQKARSLVGETSPNFEAAHDAIKEGVKVLDSHKGLANMARSGLHILDGDIYRWQADQQRRGGEDAKAKELYGKAKDAYDHALNRDLGNPISSRALNGRGIAMFRLDNPKEAVDDFKRARKYLMGDIETRQDRLNKDVVKAGAGLPRLYDKVRVMLNNEAIAVWELSQQAAKKSKDEAARHNARAMDLIDRAVEPELRGIQNGIKDASQRQESIACNNPVILKNYKVMHGREVEPHTKAELERNPDTLNVAGKEAAGVEEGPSEDWEAKAPKTELNRLGIEKLKQGDYFGAYNDFCMAQRVLREAGLDESSVVEFNAANAAYYRASQLYRSERQEDKRQASDWFDTALSHANHAHELDPNDVMVLRLRGKVHLTEGSIRGYQSAVMDFSRAIVLIDEGTCTGLQRGEGQEVLKELTEGHNIAQERLVELRSKSGRSYSMGDFTPDEAGILRQHLGTGFWATFFGLDKPPKGIVPDRDYRGDLLGTDVVARQDHVKIAVLMQLYPHGYQHFVSYEKSRRRPGAPLVELDDGIIGGIRDYDRRVREREEDSNSHFVADITAAPVARKTAPPSPSERTASRESASSGPSTKRVRPPVNERLLFDDNNLRQLSEYRRQVSENPADPIPHIGIANLFSNTFCLKSPLSPGLEQKATDVAVNELETALELLKGSDDINLLGQIGIVYENLSMYGRAEEVYRLAVQRQSESAEPHRWLANMYHGQANRSSDSEKYDAALDEYELAVTKDPEDWKVYIQKGRCHLQRDAKDDITLAIASFRNASEKAKDRASGHIDVAYEFDVIAGLPEEKISNDVRERMTQNAVRELETASKLAGDSSGYDHRYIGNAHKLAGRLELAVEAYKKAVEIDPKDSTAARSLKECQDQLNPPK